MKAITTIGVSCLTALVLPLVLVAKQPKNYQTATVAKISKVDSGVWHNGLDCDVNTQNCIDRGTGELYVYIWTLTTGQGSWTINTVNCSLADLVIKPCGYVDVLRVQEGDKIQVRVVTNKHGVTDIFIPQPASPNKELKFIVNPKR